MIRLPKDKHKYEFSASQIIVIGFAIVILIGGILLNLPIASINNENVGFLNSIFTATSAVCVTGLVVVDTGTYWTTFGKIVIMLLIQIGGLGFMSVATLGAMLIGKKISLRERLIIKESLNQSTLSGVVKLTRQMLYGTFFIEFIGALMLSFKFVPVYGLKKGIFYSVFHSVSAFCNAGFDLIGGGRSLIPFVDSGIVNITIMLLIILGGLGFTVIFDVVAKRSFRKLNLHSKIVITLSFILIAISFALFFIMESSNPDTMENLSIKGKVLASLFQSVTPRTAGFNTIDLAGMENSSKLLTIILMFIGGSPASTAGGIKTSTLAILILAVRTLIVGKENVEIFGRRISYRAVNKSLAVVFIGLFVVISGTMILSLTEPAQDFLTILFETVSAFGTVGLSLGMTSSMSNIGKILIIFTMFIGRVGSLTILLALASNEKKSLYNYPEEKVIVG